VHEREAGEEHSVHVEHTYTHTYTPGILKQHVCL